MVEIEVKIRIRDLKALRSKLISLGAMVTHERHAEENILYDFPTGILRSAHTALRLRTAGKRAILTFKGRRQKSRSFKVREEFETPVANKGQMKKILRGLGLQQTFAYKKHRTILRLGRVVVTLDETEIGDFMEIEGRRHEIVKLARSLGFSRADFITAGYVEMLRDAKAGGADA